MILRDHHDGGSCLICYSESINVYHRDDLKADIEAVWIDITVKSQKLLLGCVYRPSDDYDFYNKFYTLLDTIRDKKNLVTSFPRAIRREAIAQDPG